MVSKREWRWVLAVGAIALALSTAPYLLGLVLQTDERLFGGFVYAVEDGYSYLAKMRQGAEGAWLFHIAYTPEPHPGTLFFPFHLLLGKLAALLPGADLTARMVWTYHGARLVFGMGLLLTLYRFLAAFTPDVVVRRLAFLLVTFGGGLGWLLVALGQPEWLDSLPLDFILPEGFTFLVLYGFPHIGLARTLLLGGILSLLKAWGIGPKSEARNTRYALLAGLVWLAMGLTIPFYVLVAWAVAGAMWFALLLRGVPKGDPGGSPLRPIQALWQTALAGLLSAPIVAYSLWIFTTYPVYVTWAAQNRILSPHPLHYLAAFGVPLLLAASIAPRVWREEGPGWAALAWTAVVPVLVYLPFNLQRRLVEGAQVPLGLLAARAALEIPKPKTQSRSRLVAAGLLVALLPTNLLLVAGNSLALLPRPAPVFRDAGEVAALDWLSEQAHPGDVVLVAYGTGNYLPARVGARAFVGHGPETVHFAEKRALVAQFFTATTDDAWRQRLLAEYGVDWVFWGPAERALGGFAPPTAPYLRQVYRGGEYEVFQTTR
ncbi:MAG TPA: hypothetical protein EYH30_06135 [Anaerolineales bacterium]|nr:hypothetical protein [Anaerolineae bacterium]HIQ01692.1 hypothetical protein [Anaerolineales bacterium]